MNEDYPHILSERDSPISARNTLLKCFECRSQSVLPKDDPKEEHEVPSWNKFRTRHLGCVPDCASKLVSPMRYKITSRNLFPKGAQFPHQGVPNKCFRIACSKEIKCFKDCAGTQVKLH